MEILERIPDLGKTEDKHEIKAFLYLMLQE